MPGAYRMPFWCGKDRPTGPNADMPAKPVQTEVLGSAASPELGGRQLPREAFWGSTGLPIPLLAQVCLVHRHRGGGEAANTMEKVLSNRQSAPNRNPEVCRFLYILMTVFQGEVQANSISAFEP